MSEMCSEAGLLHRACVHRQQQCLTARTYEQVGPALLSLQ
jgi:hypothetical protein